MPAERNEQDIVEIYRTHDRLEADVIRDEVLAPNGVQCVIRDRTSRPFPMTTMAGGLYIAVDASQAERARNLIQEARSANVISDAGGFA